MVLIVFLVGLLITIIGALPPGASNLAVIGTARKGLLRETSRIIYGASTGEVILAAIAFSFGMIIQDFFEMHVWIQYVVAGILALFGIWLSFYKKDTKRRPRKYSSNYLLGFFVGLVNPLVLLFWVLIFSVLTQSHWAYLIATPLSVSILFIGIFMGKFLTLKGYSKFGLHIKKKGTSTSSINTYMGVVLISIAFFSGW